MAEGVCNYLLQLRSRLAKRRNFVWTVFIVLSLGCTLALGQVGLSTANEPTAALPAAGGGTTAVPKRAEDLPPFIAEKVDAKLKELTENQQLRSAGDIMRAFFLCALLVWTTVKSMASGKGMGELLGEWIPIFIAFGIVTLFLDRSAGALIVRTMDYIAGAIAGQDMSTLRAALDAGTTQIFKAISAVWMQPSVGSLTGTGDWVDKLINVVVACVSLLLGGLAKLAVGFCLLLAGVVMVSNIIMGYVSVQLVLALAPVMVPFLMFRPMEWMFNGWLKFLLGACMLKVVLAFLLSLAATLFTAMHEVAAEIVNQGTQLVGVQAFFSDMLLLGVTLIFATVATLLVLQAPRIAEGLLAGSASGAGFAGIRGITQSAGASVARDVSVRTGGALAQSQRNVLSGMAGARDARAGKLPSLAYRDPRAKAAYDEAYRDNFKPPNK